MKDSQGNELKIGDVVKDIHGDLSKIIGFTIGGERSQIRSTPIVNYSGIAAPGGLWHIYADKVTKIVDEEEIVLITLRGKA